MIYTEAKRWYVPRWNITNDSLLDDGFSCRTLVDRVAPLAFSITLRSMDYEQLYTIGGKTWRISELRSLLAEEAKKAETAEVVRLRDQVSTLHTAFQDFKEKAEAQQEEQAQVLYNHVAELEAHVMDVSGRSGGEFLSRLLTHIELEGRLMVSGHGIQLAVLKCLKSPEYQGILGHALGRAMDFGMQEGLEAGYEHGLRRRTGLHSGKIFEVPIWMLPGWLRSEKHVDAIHPAVDGC
ncbi:hypothetical protein Tco_0526284 [Tanacetum coccineum]